MPNYYKCSNGEKVSEATIQKRLSKAYRELYDSPIQICWGCGCQAQGSAHIIPKKRCKDLGHTEWIWLPINIIPCCYTCNSIIESYKGETFKKLKCYSLVLEITEKLDPERFKLITL